MAPTTASVDAKTPNVGRDVQPAAVVSTFHQRPLNGATRWPAPAKASVVSFVMDDCHPHDIGTIVDREGVAIRTGHHCAQPVMQRFKVPATSRASFAFYNTMAEVDALVAADASAVVACSALRDAYRHALADGRPEVRFVWLHGDPGLLRARLTARKGHFMPATLLDSQLGTLEPPLHVPLVDVAPSPEAIVATIRRDLGI